MLFLTTRIMYGRKQWPRKIFLTAQILFKFWTFMNSHTYTIPANPNTGKDDLYNSLGLSSCSQDGLHSGDSRDSSPSPVYFTSEQEQKFKQQFEMCLLIQNIFIGLGLITRSHFIMSHLAMHSCTFLLLLSCQWSHFLRHN